MPCKMPSHTPKEPTMRTLIAALTAVVLAVFSPSSLVAQQGASGQGASKDAPLHERVTSPNYDLAAQWTSREGRASWCSTPASRRGGSRRAIGSGTRIRRAKAGEFSLVDPIKKTKAPLFDHAKMAATLTSITRIPYDAQHLPFTTVRFVKKDTAFEFDVQVPADAKIATPPKRDTTTEQGGAAAGQQGRRASTGRSRPAADEPQQRGAQRRRRARAAAQPDAALRVRPRDRAGHASSTTTRRSRGRRAGRRSRPTARPWSSRARTTSS